MLRSRKKKFYKRRIGPKHHQHNFFSMFIFFYRNLSPRQRRLVRRHTKEKAGEKKILRSFFSSLLDAVPPQTPSLDFFFIHFLAATHSQPHTTLPCRTRKISSIFRFFITSRTSILVRYFFVLFISPSSLPSCMDPLWKWNFLFFCINRLFFLLRCIFFYSFPLLAIAYMTIHDDDGGL